MNATAAIDHAWAVCFPACEAMQSFKHAEMGCTLAAVQHALYFVHSRILSTACQGSCELILIRNPGQSMLCCLHCVQVRLLTMQGKLKQCQLRLCNLAHPPL